MKKKTEMEKQRKQLKITSKSNRQMNLAGGKDRKKERSREKHEKESGKEAKEKRMTIENT